MWIDTYFFNQKYLRDKRSQKLVCQFVQRVGSVNNYNFYAHMNQTSKMQHREGSYTLSLISSSGGVEQLHVAMFWGKFGKRTRNALEVKIGTLVLKRKEEIVIKVDGVELV